MTTFGAAFLALSAIKPAKAKRLQQAASAE
jgi:hypothetical protein